MRVLVHTRLSMVHWHLCTTQSEPWRVNHLILRARLRLDAVPHILRVTTRPVIPLPHWRQPQCLLDTPQTLLQRAVTATTASSIPRFHSRSRGGRSRSASPHAPLWELALDPSCSARFTWWILGLDTSNFASFACLWIACELRYTTCDGVTGVGLTRQA